jgi:methyl-accepting chemotaxis protein
MGTTFKNFSVSTKVIGAFTCVLIATIALGLFSVQRLAQVNAAAAEIRDNWLPAAKTLGLYNYNVTRLRSFQGAYLLPTTEAQRAAIAENLQTLDASADKYFQDYERTVDAGQERALADRISTAWTAYRPMFEKEMELAKTDTNAAVAYYMGPMRKTFGELNSAIEADTEFNNAGGVTAGNAGQATFESARLWIFMALGLAAFFSLSACYVLIGAVSKPLGKMTFAMGELASGRLDAFVPHADQTDEIGKLAEAMNSFKNQLAAAERSKVEQTETIVSSIGTGLDSLAKGNLTHRVAADLTGPFGKLKEDFNQAMTRLQDTMKNVLSTTNQIATGAGEISQAADDLSRRTEQQAASLEETAAALEEITSTVKKTASNTKEASTSVSSAKTAAQDGGRVVEAAIKAMDSIAQSSKQITDIIGVIDEIAFQTNLLALNAGVEAARAGDAGRGFAVVASEVRALAQRSSEAAKEIKALIKTSGEHVGAGVKLVGESGEALKHIVAQVEQINSLVSEMALAAEQQSTGIEQVNAAVGQMDQVTQQNAAMVEESTAASRNLATETQSLSSLVGFFSVGATERQTQKETSPRPATQTAAKPAVHQQMRRTSVAGHRSGAAVAVARKPETEAEDWTEF